MRRFALVLATALPFVGVDPAAAQTLEPGVWTGEISWREGGRQERHDATYAVTVQADSIQVLMNADDGFFPFSEVRLSDRTLPAGVQ